MVEGTSLENWQRRKAFVGSNPTLSAKCTARGSGRVGVDKAAQRQRCHVRNIAVTKVPAPAHCQHGGNTLQV